MAGGGKQSRTKGTTRRSPAAAHARAEAKALAAAHDLRRRWALWLMIFSVLVWVPGGFSRFVVAKLLVTAVACLVAATAPSRGQLPRPVTRPSHLLPVLLEPML